jgi:hypothetical protein
MDAVLWVLERPSPEARRLASQRIRFTDPPVENLPFACTTENGRPWKSGAVIAAQVVSGNGDIYFRTRWTPYLLERVPF